MRAMSLIVAGLIATTGWGQKSTYEITVGGTKVGENVYEERADGEFTSETNIAVAGVVIKNSITGVVKGDRLVRLKLVSLQNKATTTVEWDGAKFGVTVDGKVQRKDVPYKPSTACVFSAYHPHLNRMLWSAMKGVPAKAKVLFADSFVELPMEFTAMNNTVAGPTGPIAVSIWSVELGGTKIDAAFTQEGKPLGVNVPSQRAMFLAKGHPDVFIDPLAKYTELSQPTHKVTNLTRVRQKMRDGVELMADIVMPETPGRYPTILIRTPYGRKASLLTESWYAARGYVVVAQDVRGRGGSNGAWDPLVHEKKDGKDTLDWIVQQPWSDGKIGMIGGSYLGYTQWAAAANQHPALRCIIPQVSPPPPDQNFPWDHGAFMLMTNLWWCRVVKDREASTVNALETMKNLDAMKALPITQADNRFFRENIGFFDAWAKRRTLADWGDVFTLSDVANTRIPALHVSGVWDGDAIGTALHWNVRRAQSRDQWLIYGPWTHIFNTSHKFGDQEYGPHGILELNSVYLRFFDTYLKDREAKLAEQPRVRFFVTGSNRWIETADWPMPGAKPTTWYLGTGAKAGTLERLPRAGSASYAYDPNKPKFKEKEMEVNVTGDTTVIPKAEHGKTSLLFKTAPFAQAMTLAAPMEVELSVSTTARDATLHVMVLDVDAKGVTRLIGLPGTKRATYLDGKLRSITPGKVYSLKIQPWWFAHTFAKGHRLAILVESDAYPRFARNPGTGEPEWKATKLIKARHTIWCDPKHPSRVTLWTLPN